MKKITSAGGQMSTEFIAMRLSGLRKYRKLTQAELASKIGCAEGTIGHYEQGTKLPSMNNFVKICEVLNCSAYYLLGRTDDLNFYLNGGLPNDLSNALNIIVAALENQI
ncbi:MAG: helix-turn-helix domain-containing protein [Lactococcus sp.]